MSAGHERRTLSSEFEITVLCFVATLDASFEAIGLLRSSELVGPDLTVTLIPLALVGGKLIVLYGLTNARSWGYQWALGVYGFDVLVDLGTIHVMGTVFNVTILVWLLRRADYFR